MPRTSTHSAGPRAGAECAAALLAENQTLGSRSPTGVPQLPPDVPGVQEKSAEFRESGGEVYLPADVVSAAEAEETAAAD